MTTPAPRACDALVITCMDWRLHPHLSTLLSGHLPGRFDLISVCGATRSLLDPSEASAAQFLLTCVGTSRRLHSVSRGVIVHHTDCGASGGAEAFDNEAMERARHSDDMKAAAELIARSNPMDYY